MDVELTVAPAAAALVRLGVLTCDVARVMAADGELDGPLAAAAQQARGDDSLDTGPARHLYRTFGIDPTKTRPSSEALLRRVRKGEPIPRINTLVDLCNWCSLEAQLPYGLYDFDRIHPPVELRRGRPGETYPGIRKDDVHLEGRLVLADGAGPFGNPTSDSARTRTTEATRRVMVNVFAPASMTREAMERVLAWTAARYARYAGGSQLWQRVI